MKPSASFVAIVAAALALCGSFAPIVSKAQGVAPDPRECVKHSKQHPADLPAGRYFGDIRQRHQGTHRFINTCDHDVLLTFIFEGLFNTDSGLHTDLPWKGKELEHRRDDKWLRDGLDRKLLKSVNKVSGAEVHSNLAGYSVFCIRGGEKWLAPPGDRKQRFSGPPEGDYRWFYYNRGEYVLLRGPLTPSELEREDSRVLELVRRLSQFDESLTREESSEAARFGFGHPPTKFYEEEEYARKMFYLIVNTCPGGNREIRWCTEWADLERQKQFEKENNLRGGCREYNQPNWSDAAAKNASVRN